MSVRKIGAAVSAFFLTALGSAMALAQDATNVGAPTPWQIGLQQAASPVKAQLDGFHDLLLGIIAAIVLFVAGLLAYVLVRFRASANPVPSKNTHNTLLEVAWTVVPVVILAVIAVPSFRVLYYMDKAPNAEMTLKVTGYQWYWGYEYPDQGGIAFESYMLPAEQVTNPNLRLLEVDQRVVVPVDTDIRVLVTASDVIHSWAMPAFGVKKDAVPGRLNETWFRVEREGVYYGQCSEICGVNHAFMPIAIEAVSKEAFADWVQQQQAKLGIEPTTQVAKAAIPAGE
ncbi:cytochrome c oxidase subunit II [Indioceanicola profundi]|uniref:cytochrome c oxidase subunit II n=1 Tax=Indioceanicola profundi TaxID=2220096 RepID=UPI000E6AD2BA|nr:cytochrome c oxidase subunit II [Indioceanicola profundi]